MRRILNTKKAQADAGGFPLSVIVGIIIILIVAFLVVMGPSKVFSFISGVFGYAPNDLTQASAACTNLYSTNAALLSDYCQYRLLTLNNQKGYYNCIGVSAAEKIAIGKTAIPVKVCGTSELASNEAYCVQLKTKTPSLDLASTYVNGNICANIMSNGNCVAGEKICSSLNIDQCSSSNEELANYCTWDIATNTCKDAVSGNPLNCQDSLIKSNQAVCTELARFGLCKWEPSITA